LIGVGIIGRDHNGNICLAFTACRRFFTDRTSAEALAAWTLADICVRVGYNDVILEGDALEVVQAMNREEFSCGRYGALINDAKILLQQVQHWKVRHVKRAANAAAHRLAKLAFSFSEERLWIKDFPLCVREIVIAESFPH
jgi:hypothetical protein